MSDFISSLQGALALYTLVVYNQNVIHTVALSSLAKKQLKRLPVYIVVNFQNWVEDVEARGLEEVRKIPGYHDEPLKGELRGFRSIWFSRDYRA